MKLHITKENVKPQMQLKEENALSQEALLSFFQEDIEEEESYV